MWRAQTGSWLTDPTRVADPHTWAWLPVAAGIGVGLHLVGDMLTVKGVPLLWPARLRLAAPLLGHTDTAREQLVGACLSLALVALAWVQILRPLLNTKGTHFMLPGYSDILDAAGRQPDWWTHQLLTAALCGDLPAMLRDDGLARLFGHRCLVMLPLAVHGLPSEPSVLLSMRPRFVVADDGG